jgi:uncharacterized membrane protein YhhN
MMAKRALGMPPSFYLAATATALAVVALLFAERTGARVRAAVAKPLASAGFLAAAWNAGAAESSYGRGVLAALALSAIGDVLLLGSGRRFFVLGLATFLLAHLAFCFSFVMRGVTPAVAGGAAVPLAIAAAFVWRWLGTHVAPELRGSVIAYIGVVSAMVALAFGTSWARPAPPLTFGALAFYASDLAVARDEFVAKSFKNRLWGLPTYYLGQLLIAASVAYG